MSNLREDGKDQPAEKNTSDTPEEGVHKFKVDERFDAKDVAKAQRANLNRHSGSAGGDQESLEIVGYGKHASSASVLTEKDLTKHNSEHNFAQKHFHDHVHGKKHPLLLKGSVQQSVRSDHEFLEQIASLSKSEQAQVIGAGLLTFEQELFSQQKKISASTIEGVQEGFAELNEHAKKFVKDMGIIWQFSQDMQHDHPAAYKSAAQGVNAFSKVVVGGVRLIDITAAYLKNVGETGEYSKPFHDIKWLGDQIDKRWKSLPPEKQAKITAKLATEEIPELMIGLGLAKFQKSEKVTAAIQDLGEAASSLNSKSRIKVGQFLTGFLDHLLEEPAEAAAAHEGKAHLHISVAEIAKVVKPAKELVTETKDQKEKKTKS